MKIKNIHAAPALLIFVFALLALSGIIDYSYYRLNGNPYLYIIILQLLIFAVPSLFFVRLRGRGYAKSLRLRFVRGSQLSTLVYALGLIVSGSSAISMLMFRLFPDEYNTSSVTNFTSYIDQSGVFGWLYAVLAFALLPALTEEFLFRGIILAEYEKSGIFTAVILSSLTFAMVHFNIVMFPVYLFNGIVLGMLLYGTRSLLAPITVHAISNIFTLVFEGYVYQIAVKETGGYILLAFLLVSGIFLFSIMFFGRLEKTYALYGVMNVKNPYTKKRRKEGLPYFIEAVLSPTFLLLLVFFIIISLAF